MEVNDVLEILEQVKKATAAGQTLRSTLDQVSSALSDGNGKYWSFAHIEPYSYPTSTSISILMEGDFDSSHLRECQKYMRWIIKNRYAPIIISHPVYLDYYIRVDTKRIRKFDSFSNANELFSRRPVEPSEDKLKEYRKTDEIKNIFYTLDQ